MSAPTITLAQDKPRVWRIETDSATGDVAKLVACPDRGRCSNPRVGYYHAPFLIMLAE